MRAPTPSRLQNAALLGICLLSFASLGCQKRTISVWQDRHVSWVQSPTGPTARELFDQTNASEGSSNASIEYSSVFPECDTFAGDAWNSIADRLTKAHSELFNKKDAKNVGWADDTAPNEGVLFSVVKDSLSAGGGVGITKAVGSASLKAAYKSESTNLVVAFMARHLVLSSRAMRCLRKNICHSKPAGTRCEFVSTLFYGSAIRLRLASRTLSSSGELDAKAVGSAELSLKASSFSIEGAILGGLVPPKDVHYDVPNMLDDLKKQELVHLQSRLTEMTKKYSVIAYRTEAVHCP